MVMLDAFAYDYLGPKKLSHEGDQSDVLLLLFVAEHF
jgi:hypothetical protein